MLTLAGSRGNNGELTIERIDGIQIAYKILDLSVYMTKTRQHS